MSRKRKLLYYLAGMWLTIVVSQCIFPKEKPFVKLAAGFTANGVLYSKLLVVEVGTEVKFVQHSVVARSFSWNFGDNNNLSNEKNPVRTYVDKGEYKVTLIAEAFGDQPADTVTQTIKVINKIPSFKDTGENFYGSTKDETGFCFAITGDGYVLVGRQEINQLYVVKIDQSKKAGWETTITIDSTSNALVFPKSIIVTSDGDYIIVGYYQSSLNAHNTFILKLDANGNQLWLKKPGSLFDQRYLGVIEDLSSKQYIVLGNNKGSMVLTSYTQSGILLSQKDFIEGFEAASFRLAKNGGFVVAGTLNDSLPTLRRLSKDLVKEWDIPVSNIKGNGLEVIQLNNFDYVLVGNIVESKTAKAFIAKIKNTCLEESYLYQDSFYDVAETSDGSLIVVGAHQNLLDKNGTLLVRYDKNLDQQGAVLLKTLQNEINPNIKISDGNILLLCTAYNSNRLSRDLYFVELAPDEVGQ